MVSDLMKKAMKNAYVKEADVLSASKYFQTEWGLNIPTKIPMMNVALSGSFTGGIQQGLMMLVGDSKTFKTGFLLEFARAFQQEKPNGIILFYDSEFGTTPEYFASRGVDMSRVLHIPIKTVEDLKFDLGSQLDGFAEEDDVMILVDSIGNLASKKEAEDAKDGNDAADMTRAKSLNSLFRVVTPELNMKRIPMMCINHYYLTQERYPKVVISGGKKLMLSSDDAWLITRTADKDGKDLKGWHFNISIEKSRTVKEKEKFPIHVTYEDGLNELSGLFEEAVDFGAIVQRGAWYTVRDQDTGKESVNKRKQQIVEDVEYFERLMKREDFQKFVREKYVLEPTNGIKEE